MNFSQRVQSRKLTFVKSFNMIQGTLQMRKSFITIISAVDVADSFDELLEKRLLFFTILTDLAIRLELLTKIINSHLTSGISND